MKKRTRELINMTIGNTASFMGIPVPDGKYAPITSKIKWTRKAGVPLPILKRSS